MTTIREQCLAQLKTKLATLVTAVPAARQERNRHHPVQVFPALVLRDGPQEVLPEGQLEGSTRYVMGVGVELYVQSAAAGTDMNALYAEALAAVLDDRRLGGVAVDVREVGLSEPEHLALSAHDGGYLALSLDLEVEFWTAEGDPETLGT